ncbi:MAG: hypothetical protein ACK4UN_08890, partial [Limisphaerales bacterium]
QRAENTKCINNLKQFGNAISLYAGDHNDLLPGPSWIGVSKLYVLTAGNPPENRDLVGHLAPYLGLKRPTLQRQTGEVAVCPSYNKAEGRSFPKGTAAEQSFSYFSSPGKSLPAGSNIPTWIPQHPWGQYYYPMGRPEVAAPQGLPKRMTAFRDPSRAWGLMDSDKTLVQAFGFTGPWSEFIPTNGISLHGKSWNRVYFDGHVAPVKNTNVEYY